MFGSQPLTAILGAVLMAALACDSTAAPEMQDTTLLPLNSQVVDTGQDTCFGVSGAIPCPAVGESLHGQVLDGRQPPVFRSGVRVHITPMDPGGKLYYVLYVRGEEGYGVSDLVDNGDGTVTDRAAGLMWDQEDSGEGMDWEAALAWVQARNEEAYLGYMDGQWMDVHGAGAQRSDPKVGDAGDWPTGHGPQGDAIRIDNFVRPVRTI